MWIKSKIQHICKLVECCYFSSHWILKWKNYKSRCVKLHIGDSCGTKMWNETWQNRNWWNKNWWNKNWWKKKLNKTGEIKKIGGDTSTFLFCHDLFATWGVSTTFIPPIFIPLFHSTFFSAMTFWHLYLRVPTFHFINTFEGNHHLSVPTTFYSTFFLLCCELYGLTLEGAPQHFHSANLYYANFYSTSFYSAFTLSTGKLHHHSLSVTENITLWEGVVFCNENAHMWVTVS